jgi:hypothetical protein
VHAAGRLLLAAPMIGALAFAAGVVVSIARADHLVGEAAVEMSTWGATGSRPSLGTWTSVYDKLEAARAILPTDPITSELLGLLASQRSDSAEILDSSVDHMVRALSLRPVSAYTWANLVETRYRRGEPGANVELAIRRAAELGSSEPGVQRIIADYGLALWDELTPQAQGAVDQLVGAGARRNPLEMLQISERRGRLGPVCKHLLGASRIPDAKLVNICQSREITP